MEGMTMEQAIIANRRTLIILGTLMFFGVVLFFLAIYSDKRKRR